jgi:hypothetical protein
LGLVLPPRSPEWDPPIPLPPTAELRPRVSIKAIRIPDMSFAAYRLSEERLAEYEALAVSIQRNRGPGAETGPAGAGTDRGEADLA